MRKFKCEISKLTIKSKCVVKKHENSSFITRKKTKVLESTVKYLDNSECITCKAKLDQLYDEKANGIRLRNKCDWYEYLSFRNLE